MRRPHSAGMQKNASGTQVPKQAACRYAPFSLLSEEELGRRGRSRVLVPVVGASQQGAVLSSQLIHSLPVQGSPVCATLRHTGTCQQPHTQSLAADFEKKKSLARDRSLGW